MPLPNISDVRAIDPINTSLSLGYKNSGYCWDKLAPFVPVPERTGKYWKYPREWWFRLERGADRAPGTPYQRLHTNMTTASYEVQEYGFEEVVDDVIRKSSQVPETLDSIAIKHLSEMMQLKLEKDVAGKLFKTGVWATDKTLSGSAKWNDYTNSNPITDLQEAQRTIRLATGVKPNSMHIGTQVWDILKEHPDIIDKYKQVQVGIMTESLVAAVLEIPILSVGEVIENTAQEGVDVADEDDSWTAAEIWGKHALLFNKVDQPGMMVPNAAYTFIWDEKGNIPWAMEQYREESIRCDVHRIFTHYSVNAIAPDYGYFFNQVVA